MNTKRGRGMINSIIYLDEDKMYSLSSQIFEGVTEYVLKEVNSTKENSEEQKGPIGSGKVLADAMKLSERSVEKRFLHDHSLSLFEARLAELNLVSHVDATANIDTEKSFVRVSARASFIDAAKITSMIGSFNKIGEALAHVTNYSKIENTRKELQGLKDKSAINELRQIETKLSNTAELAKQSGLYQDPLFLKNLALVTEFGFSDQLEVQQRIGGRPDCSEVFKEDRKKFGCAWCRHSVPIIFGENRNRDSAGEYEHEGSHNKYGQLHCRSRRLAFWKGLLRNCD
jgi:hypothetical protein